jgi:replicative DNA helicase
MPVRKMPQNLEAEMAVLGVAFIDKNATSKICEELTSDMFYSDQNKKIFEAIKSMYESKTPIDITTITEELDKKKNLSAIGGIEYLSEVIDSVATTSNLDYYIKIVKDKAIARYLIDTANEIVTDAYDYGDDITRLLDKSEMNILNVVKSRRTSEFSTINDVLKRAREQLDFLAKNKSALSGLSTGFKVLDRATTGFHGGEVIIIAARPGMGKTAFALNIAVGAAKSTTKAVAIFNLEMPAEQLVNRMISAKGAIEGRKLQTGQLMPNDWNRYNEAVAELASTNIYIEDNASITASESILSNKSFPFINLLLTSLTNIKNPRFLYNSIKNRSIRLKKFMKG